MNKIIACAILMGAMIGSGAIAQDYPTRPITVVVQFPEKSPIDVFARSIAEKLAIALGQPVVVQNAPGKSGSVAVAQVAKAAPDGYTLALAGDAPLTTTFVVFESLGYDPRRDLAPIAQLFATQNAVIVPAASPARSLADVVKTAKEKPGQLSYAHPGTGLSSHVAGELLKKQAGIDLKPVEISAGEEFFKAVEGGQVLFGITGANVVSPGAKEGKLRAVAVTGPQRSPLFPDVPTLTELGLAGGYDASAWFSLVAPKGTPEPIIAKLSAESTKIVGSPDMAARLTALGARPIPSTPAQLAERISASIATLTDLLKDVPKQK